MTERNECNSKGTISDAEFERWVVDNPPPSLDALIAKHGDYSSIPAYAWVQWDAEVWDWQQRRKDRLYGRSP